jgi:hypothetical protein
MTPTDFGERLDPALEEQIASWRGFVERRSTVAPDIAELEDHLRDQVADLEATGLAPDEAFLVAVKRMGSLHDLSREFAREHSDRLWKQLVLADDAAGPASSSRDLLAALAVAVGAGLAVLAPRLFGLGIDDGDGGFLVRNISLLVLPFLAGWFAWRRRLGTTAGLAVVGIFALAAVAVNVYPFGEERQTEILAAIHLPILLWLVVGVAYTGGDWRSSQRRMDFLRFTGEWAIYYALIAFGGGVLVALTMGAFSSIGLDAEDVVFGWLLPSAAAGAVIVAAWLVEAKQSVIENMAPVLTKVFTPLTALLLLAFLAAAAVTGNPVDAEREFLILFDLVLVLTLGLLLYSYSARDPFSAPGLFDRLQLVLLASALVVDLLMLAAMVGRISEFGFSPNKTAALGLNLILLANLSWAAWLQLGFLRGRRAFPELERWQTAYLPVYAVWAAVVVVAFPPVFGFA